MRVVRSYAAVVSFISVIVVVIASLAFVWALLGLIAPGVYQAGARTEDIRVLLDEATVLAVFAWVFSTHRRLVGVR
jgi:CBS domain containing-hemolysin-like protein